ncbi:NAD(P)H-quinone oxidoreductase [Porticoccus sp.]|uniref:NAD(P)H-quinone oxidoreductase n=1 Tax=Porticoccus sp. TaxID=2024853 RepID=UPI003F69ED19
MTLPREMACIEIGKPGSAEVLTTTRRPVMLPGDNEVLIRVRAAGVNRPDVLQRQGRYPPPPGASDIPGLEVAGEIVSVGNNETSWQVGQSVCALLSGGGYSEYAIAHESLCLPIPAPFNLIQAAAIPETFCTVWSNLFHKKTLQPGETLLVHGGSSGIGTTAIQLANMLDHRIFTTAGSDEKCAYCLQLGAEAAINYRQQDFVEEIKSLTDGVGADVILDMVGGDYIGRNIRAAAFRGRILSIAFLKGSRVEVDLMPVMLNQLVLTGSTLRGRPVAEKAAIARSMLENVWPLLENGAIAPVINETFPLAQAAKAHQLMESSEHIGKIVLTLD